MAATVEERLERLEAQVAEIAGRTERARRPAFGLTIEEVKARGEGPVKRSPETIARFRRMMGSFDGSADLSERMRDYLYGDYPDGKG